MKANRLAGMALFFAVVVLPSCRGTEKTEAITAEITAAQMEGRTAARNFIHQNWRDTSLLARRLDTVENRKSRFISEGKAQCAQAYDSAFVTTLRAVKPELSRAVEKHRRMNGK